MLFDGTTKKTGRKGYDQKLVDLVIEMKKESTNFGWRRLWMPELLYKNRGPPAQSTGGPRERGVTTKLPGYAPLAKCDTSWWNSHA